MVTDGMTGSVFVLALSDRVRSPCMTAEAVFCYSQEKKGALMRSRWRMWFALASAVGAVMLSGSASAEAQPTIVGAARSSFAPAFYTYQGPNGANTFGKRVIALTFDDGPGPYTPQVLAILEHYGIAATFFDVGEEVAQFPQYAKIVAAAGYPVEDHTWTHADLSTIPVSEFPFQIDQTQNEIRAVTGQAPECVRPPYDSWNATALNQIGQRGLVTMSYSVDPRDWSLPGVQAIVDRVVGAAFPGAVVDMHDAGGPRDETVAALPQIITDLRSEGYTFVSICGSPTAPVPRPSAIAPTSSSMDVFFRTPAGQLAADYWNPMSGWATTLLPGGADVTGDPAALTSSPASMNVFFRTPAGQLAADYWNPKSGWANVVLPGGADVGADPSAIAPTSSSMDVFFRTAAGQLAADYWNPKSGWANVVLPGGADVTGDPAALTLSPASMDVFFRTAAGQLAADYWNPMSGWATTLLPGGADVTGDPAALTSSPASMNVFFRTPAGQLAADYWNPKSGWANVVLPGGADVGADPSAIAPTSSSMDVFFRTAAGQLAADYWNPKSGWANVVLPGGADVTGDPAALTLSPAAMDVFFRTAAGQLAADYWNPKSGWANVILP